MLAFGKFEHGNLCRLCGGRGLATGESHGPRGAIEQRRHGMHIGRAAPGLRAEEQHHRRLADGGEPCQHFLGHGRCRRLGHDGDDLGRRVAREHVDGLQHGGAAYGLVHIAAAGADGLRYAATEAVDLRRHFLQAGARSGDDANGAAAHDVGKAQRHAVDDGGAAIGPHHQQALARTDFFDRLLLFDGHVVAEHEHMHAQAQGLERFGGGIGAGYRNLRKPRLQSARVGAHRHGKRTRLHLDDIGGAALGRSSGEQMFDLSQRLGKRRIIGLDQHHHVVGPRTRHAGIEQAGLL